MSYLDKIARCNRRTTGGYARFVVGGRTVGWIAPERVEVLAGHGRGCFDVSPGRVTMLPGLETPDQRSRAVADVAPALVASGSFADLHGESYAVRNSWNDPPLFQLDRSLAPGFGVRAYGVHLNGYVRTPRGLSLWIGTRSADRRVEPGKLDNMVAGGQPAGLSLRANLTKECAEEAGLGADLAALARPTGAICYAFTTATGLRNDTMFCFDLEVPPSVTPVAIDGEMDSFELMPLEDVLGLVRNTDRIKFNVNLVLIDFAVRHGALTPENTPDYESIVTGLRNPLAMD